ncbi:MAG TPA: hypothetical protein VK648_09510 [Gemmatimonadaceae bacterium]|nr:hypothetical protein [Gemmatimonadaceae bacterium]
MKIVRVFLPYGDERRCVSTSYDDSGKQIQGIIDSSTPNPHRQTTRMNGAKPGPAY